MLRGVNTDAQAEGDAGQHLHLRAWEYVITHISQGNESLPLICICIKDGRTCHRRDGPVGQLYAHRLRVMRVPELGALCREGFEHCDLPGTGKTSPSSWGLDNLLINNGLG
eukprot:GHVU01002066.1.p2 GENE.GHVU01002066.1~~GHVU01002066.1.p2  ORF type:complete len:111 (+),score=2.31 GHVU01002066.1:314-646(+)